VRGERHRAQPCGHPGHELCRWRPGPQRVDRAGRHTGDHSRREAGGERLAERAMRWLAIGLHQRGYPITRGGRARGRGVATSSADESRKMASSAVRRPRQAASRRGETTVLAASAGSVVTVRRERRGSAQAGAVTGRARRGACCDHPGARGAPPAPAMCRLRRAALGPDGGGVSGFLVAESPHLALLSLGASRGGAAGLGRRFALRQLPDDSHHEQPHGMIRCTHALLIDSTRV
jgi:hypothetical protein